MEKNNHERTEELLEILRNFRLLDDTFFSECFDGNTECTELILRIILDMPDLKVLRTNTQRSVKNLMLHEARLDAYTEDSRGNAYDIEVQRSDTGAEIRRARFYSSMLDSRMLRKGEKYRSIPDSFVIFITVMRRGNSVYRIERCIMDTREEFRDGSHIVYVNGSYRGSSPIGRLMHDFSCISPDEMNYKVLADRVRYYKESKEGVDKMCRAVENLVEKYGKQYEEIGETRGTAKEKKATALRMLNSGKYSLNEIADISELSIEEIQILQIKPQR